MTPRPATATDLLLIRHAEVPPPPDGSVGARPDPGLSPEGREAACELAEWLDQHLRPDALVASDLLRAVQTAEPLATRLGLETGYDRDWRELHLGAPAGIADDRVREGWEGVRARPGEVAFPGGESLEQLAERVERAVQRTLREHRGRTVAVVTHGGVLETHLWSSLGAPLTTMARVWVHAEPTGIFHWRIPDAEGAPHELIASNWRPHLEPGRPRTGARRALLAPRP